MPSKALVMDDRHAALIPVDHLTFRLDVFLVAPITLHLKPRGSPADTTSLAETEGANFSGMTPPGVMPSRATVSVGVSSAWAIGSPHENGPPHRASDTMASTMSPNEVAAWTSRHLRYREPSFSASTARCVSALSR